MKENIDRIFREQLENYEMPYENGAWEQFSKRLDGAPSNPFYKKWWFAASIGTVLVGSATYFALSGSEQPASAPAPQEKVMAHNTASTQNTPSGQAKVYTIGGTQPVVESSAIPIAAQRTASVETPVDRRDNGTPGTTPSRSDAGQPMNVITTPIINVPVPVMKFSVPASVCLNESFSIDNPNDAAITVILPNRKTKTIYGKQSSEIKASEAGTITVQSGNQTETIAVNEGVSHMTIEKESLIYENGVPTIRLEVTGAERAVTWKTNVSDEAVSASKNELTIHPFTEREVVVTAYSTDQNGCPVSEKESIINAPYNLLAPTGFNPMDINPRTNHFIPFALTQRDTPFEMIIMDSKNMMPVFRTTDAAIGWDGIDSRSGQLVPLNSLWLWKVVLKDPLPGEPKEYTGLITRTDW